MVALPIRFPVVRLVFRCVVLILCAWGTGFSGVATSQVVPGSAGSSTNDAGTSPEGNPSRTPSRASRATRPDRVPEQPSVGRIVRERFPTPSSRQGITWETWWALNKDRFLRLHDRFVLTHWISGPGGLVGRSTEDGEWEARLTRFRSQRREVLLPFLLEAVRSREHPVRISALFALGHLRDRAAVEPLVAMLGDPDRTTREMVVLALGMIGDERAQPDLAAILNGGEPGRRRVGGSRIPQRLRGLAAVALGLLHAKQQGEELLCMAVRRRKLPVDIRMGAITALGLVGTDNAVAELSSVVASSRESPALRSLAVTALAHTGRTSALVGLARALEDKHPDVQAAAVLATEIFPYETEAGARYRARLAAFHTARDAGRLGPAEVTEQARVLRREAEQVDRVEGPRRQKRAIFRQQLRRRIERYRGARDQGLAAVALGGVGQWKDAALLARTLTRGAIGVRGFAAIGLGLLARGDDPGGRIAELLGKRFVAEKSNPRLQAALALALALAGEKKAGPLLLAAHARTTNQGVRTYLALALGLLRHREAYAAARATVVGAREPWVLHNAVQGFSLLADPITGARLMEPFRRTHNQSEQRALAAALAFSAVGVKETMEPLLAYLGSKENPAINRAFVAEAVGLAANLLEIPALSRVAAGHNFAVETPVIDLIIRLRW